MTIPVHSGGLNDSSSIPATSGGFKFRGFFSPGDSLLQAGISTTMVVENFACGSVNNVSAFSPFCPVV